MKKKHVHLKIVLSSLLPVALLILVVSTYFTQVQAQENFECKMSDLNIVVDIPEGYTRIPTACPKIAYKSLLNPNHAFGFYITKTPYPYHSSDKKSPSETVDDYILIVQVSFDKAYKGQSYNTFRINESADFPPSLVDHGGACGGLVTRTPISYQGREGVEWRRGVMCLVESPPRGSDKWSIIQAFFFDKNLERTDYKPTGDFKQAARNLFRSIQFKEQAEKANPLHDAQKQQSFEEEE